jgi:predicted XRE-type DNA-binding protein
MFAQIEMPDANEEFNKAQLAMYLRQAINGQRLTKSAAAARMSIEEPKVSALMNGCLESFSSEQLMRLLTALGRDIEIRVKDIPRSRTRGLIRVRNS